MVASYERFILFTSIAISCMRTSAQHKKLELLPQKLARRTKGLLDVVCRCLPIYEICGSYHRYSYNQMMRTFHHHLHVIDQTIYYIEHLGSSHPGLLEGESIKTLKNRFDVFLSQ